VPFVNVEVGAADSGAMHANEHVVDADRWLGNILQPQARFGFAFDQCFHLLNSFNFVQYRHTASLMKDKLRPSDGRISAKPLISPAGKEHLPEIAALAQIIWRAHYPGIISNEQIEYMLARMYDCSVMEAEL